MAPIYMRRPIGCKNYNIFFFIDFSLKLLYFLFSVFFFNNFIYFWLHWTFVAVQGLSLVVVLRLLTVVASLVAELRL